MGHPGFNRQWARSAEQQYEHRGHGRGGHGPFGDWSKAGGPGWSGRQGPPPWVAGLFGLDQGDRRRGPRVRRGDVRSAILDVLRTAGADEQAEPLNGYTVIQEIAERSGGAWKPSPGSVYPTIQQLQDEGLVVAGDESGRRTLALSSEGQAYVRDHADELAAVWAPFERREREEGSAPFGELKPEIGQVMGAVWQIVTSGTPAQQRAAIDVLVDTRRRLYGILADGDPSADDAEDES